MQFVERVRSFIEHHALFGADDLVMVGLSGGADSVALLRVLCTLGIRCMAIHCNFHLRGEESDRDQDFAEQLCHLLGVPCLVASFETSRYAEEQGISIEMAARELRYTYFERVRKEKGANCVAVAHHRDDSVETVLLNMIRGTGIHGLCGIRPRVKHVVRPLLDVSRQDIEAYLKVLGQDFVTDHTNLETLYKRNRVRLELLPLMREINPSIDRALLRMARISCDVSEIYDVYVHKELSNMLCTVGDHVELPIEKLRSSVGSLSLLYTWLHPYGFGRGTVEQIYEELNGPSGARYVCGAYTVWRDREMLVLMADGPDVKNDSFFLSPGETLRLNGDNCLCCEVLSADEMGSVSRDRFTASLDGDKLKMPLSVRRLRTGDRFVPFGMKGSKLLSDYLTDCKISRVRRSSMWVVCSGENIVWLVGERIDGRYAIGQTTQKIVRLVLLKDQPEQNVMRNDFV